MKTPIPQLVIAVLIVCFGSLQNAHAVSPTPDGAYPNFTTAEGQNALKDLTTGAGNTALGAFSMFSTTTASFNTAVGAGALDLNTGDQNTAVGVAALLLNTGTNNTAVGVDALGLNSTGGENTATGAFALYSNTTGNANTGNGDQTLRNNTTGFSNTAVGDSALLSNTTGAQNTANGGAALVLNTTGSDNTAVGDSALLSNTTGAQNIALGDNAGSNLTTGNNNIDIGNVGAAGESNTIRIGVQGTQTFTIIAGISNDIQGIGTPVIVTADGFLGVATSSARFKDEIRQMGNASEALFALNPVSFRYKKEIDPAGTRQLGLVAEEVEKVNPDLIVRDKEGKPYSVRYDQVNAMLLNEFLKAHRKMEEQDATIARQQRQIDALAAGLQKVSAQLELSKAAPQTVLNKQ
jgi:hypothetical protein